MEKSKRIKLKNTLLSVKKAFVFLLMESLLASCKWNNGLKKETIMMIFKNLHFSQNLENGKL
jgi:hypothetical protein